MQREFIIVYKAKPTTPYETETRYLVLGTDSSRAVTTDITEATVFSYAEVAEAYAKIELYSKCSSIHEPGVVMEKITTISLKPVD